MEQTWKRLCYAWGGTTAAAMIFVGLGSEAIEAAIQDEGKLGTSLSPYLIGVTYVTVPVVGATVLSVWILHQRTWRGELHRSSRTASR